MATLRDCARILQRSDTPMARYLTTGRLLIILVITLGLAFGLGAFTFVYARGYSYLSNDAAACANCHVMREHFDAWNKSTHRAVATCNSCHTPHDLIGKYTVKAKNGFWHSFYFTTGRYPDPLRITEGNRQVAEESCRYCHAAITQAIDPAASPNGRRASEHVAQRSNEPASCVGCHRYVGHLVR
jgi:cytochrome c nitrite reductase small subunit